MFVEFDLKQLKLAFYLLTSIHFNSHGWQCRRLVSGLHSLLHGLVAL